MIEALNVFDSAKGTNVKTRAVFGILVLFALASWSSAGIAYDRWYAGGAVRTPYVGYGYGGGYGAYGTRYGLYGAGYGGGFGSAYSGMGNLVRAEGQRNVSNSQAAINYQQANLEREKARNALIDNQDKLHKIHRERKQEAEADDAKKREAMKEADARGEKFEAAHRPLPLSTSQLDPATGRIDWPKRLKSPDFDDLRKSLEQLFKTRAESGVNDDLAAEIEMKVGSLKNSLRSQITQIPLPEYSESRKFLDRLANSVN